MSTKLDKMSKEFKQLADLQETLNKLEEENKNLKLQLDSSLSKNDIEIMTCSEESICKTQLEKLQTHSLQRELTLEEARKVEIYSKILIALADKLKTFKGAFKELKDSDLLKAIEDKH